MRQVTVVGASLAGLSAVRALREQGFDGRLTVVGAETHLPYDRPPLSKAFLAGTADVGELALLGEADDALDVDWQLGVAAVALRPSTRQVVLADGRAITGDGGVRAPGARARRRPGLADRPGVPVLRTLDDALALRADLRAGGSLVIVGAGFIGAEVASTAQAAGLQVTVVEAMSTPLAGPLGEQMGAACAGLHADHGVRLLTGTGVARLLGRRRVSGVELTDGTVLPADVVLVGVGATPDVAWLADSGLELDEGVVTDACCATSLPGVVAVGDCARSFDPVAGRHRRIEHWTHALQQPATAAATLLGASSTPYAALPYFWSEQYGRQLQFAGSREPGDVVTVVEGSTEERRFVATYERAGRLVAVLGLDAPGPFSRLRRTLRTQHAAVAS